MGLTVCLWFGWITVTVWFAFDLCLLHSCMSLLCLIFWLFAVLVCLFCDCCLILVWVLCVFMAFGGFCWFVTFD